ncbi:M23/M56 family metallopeptidase [Pseudoduganella sp. LjRoot289]|uniref:M23/M56 family metallopeptidase n=1 Tax=Pseudoduganella sp. LjRoot289 TaxID=3342314 RepID=UPI003ECF0D4B
MLPLTSLIATPVFLLASATCLAAGGLAWALLKLAERVWPGIAAQRAVWLLAQFAVAATFALALLPRDPELSMVPPIELARPAQRAADSAVGLQASVGVLNRIGLDAGPDGGYGDADLDAAGAAVAPPWLVLMSQAWLACYGAGLLYAAARWAGAQRALRGLLGTADRLGGPALRMHAGFADELPYRGPPVLETDAPVSPMLVGLLAPRLLLPAHLASFDAQQQQLIIAHELTHWRRRDHLWLHVSLLLETVFWFNPAVRLLRVKLNWAQELGCDQQVLAGRPAQERQSYAAALVAQLKLQHAMMPGAYPTSAFGGAGLAALSARIKLIRSYGTARSLGALGKTLMGGSLLALLAGSVLLQPAFAWRSTAPAPAATLGDGAVALAAPGPGGPGALERRGAAQADAGSASGLAGADGLDGAQADEVGTADGWRWPAWRAPLEPARVSSFYGRRPKPLPSSSGFHAGIDFAAKRGTPVLAPAAGTVLQSTALYDGQPKYGQVIVIDHGNGLRSMVAHLDRRSVRAGDSVAAGQEIGLSGASGRVTGPHLHLEVLRDGEHVDPARLIAKLDDKAFPSALRARAAALAD